MKKIRHNVFETNSSSTHSISVRSDNVGTYQTLYPDKDGVLTFEGGEFGWEFAKYCDAITKAEYLVTLFKVHNVSDQALFEKVVLDHTGAKSIAYNIKEEFEAYIDHQSREDLTSPIFNLTYETMKDFIFNPKSLLMTGNDNDTVHWVDGEIVEIEDDWEYDD
jgi:hypothetical protein